jgi:acetyl esterase
VEGLSQGARMQQMAALDRWLDPEMRAFVARTEAFYSEGDANGGISEVRAAYARMCAAFRAPRPEGVIMEDMIAPGAPGLRRYRPAQPCRSAVVLYAHGGGFVLGDLDSHDDACAGFCAGTGMEVVAVDYRLAPEHPYPAALDDLTAAYRALTAQGRRVVVAGDSAGGNLAAALCHRLRRLGVAQPCGQVLIYPLLSPDPLRIIGSRAAIAPLLSAEECLHYLRLYAGGAVRATDPEFAPLAAADFAGLAPAAIFAAGYDPLRQDAEDYAAALHAVGVAVEYREDPGLVHGWLRARHTARLAARAFAAVVRAMAALADGRVQE